MCVCACVYIPLSFLVGHVKRSNVLSLVSSDDTDINITARALGEEGVWFEYI